MEYYIKIFSLKFLFFMQTNLALANESSEIKCPDETSISIINLNEKRDILEALNKIIPEIYSSNNEKYNEKYSIWKPVLITPFTKINQFDRPYYNNSKLLCGEKVTNRSWLVKIYFPKWESLASPASGILFIAKNKNNKWFVWNRYR